MTATAVVRGLVAASATALVAVLLGAGGGGVASAAAPIQGAAAGAVDAARGTAYVATVAGPMAAAPAADARPSAVRALPRHSGTGRRIVYSERTPQHVWLVDKHGTVVRDFAVSGRANWPRAGTYRVFSKSPRSWSTTYGVSFRWMVRFAHGHHASIGFHTIPRYRSGKRMHAVGKLGRPVGRGGCPHSADPDARFLYRWATIGTKVVVTR